MVWAMAATTTVNYGVLVYAIAIFLPVMRRDFGASLGELSAAVSIAVAVSGLLAPLAGAWLDRHGARALMTVGSVVALLSVFGWSRAHSLPTLYASFVGIGIASAGVLYDAAFAVVNTWFDRDRNSALLTLTVVAGFASTIFLPLSQGLVDWLGWRSALTVLAVLCGLTAIPHFAFVRRPPPTPGVIHPHGWLHLRDAALRQALAQSSVRWLTAATVAVTTGVTAVVVHLVSYLHTRGYSPTAAAFGVGAIGVLSVTGRITLTSLARRLRLARVAGVMVSGQVIGLLTLMWLPRPFGLIVFVLTYGAGYGVITIARAALLSDYVPVSVFARVSGVQALVTDVGRVIAPVAAGALITWTGGYTAMLVAIIACSGFAALSLVIADAKAQTSVNVA
jgi:MFS family permease